MTLANLQRLIALFLIVLTSTGRAAAFLQVDVIVFTHAEAASSLMLAPITLPQRTLTLAPSARYKENAVYQSLPSSLMGLRNEYWALHRKPQYRVLWHESWRQPIHKARPIHISTPEVDGFLHINYRGYYVMTTQLYFNNAHVRFEKQQRIKPNTVYYVDHPNVGLLIHIHPQTS